LSFHLAIRNESSRKRLYRRKALCELMKRICAEERIEGPLELSLLFCDDPFIRQLNREYRKQDESTDVLCFGQERQTPAHPAVLGDIVISLETVERNTAGRRESMWEEVRLLFCHGLLHLLGYGHNTVREREAMQLKQARYLGTTKETAWRTRPEAEA